MSETNDIPETIHLRERNARLEAAIARIARETESAFLCPEVSFVTIHRIANVAGRMMREAHAT
jgi:hypothetical protein